MYVLVLLLNEKDEFCEEHAFSHDFPEMPQVGDIIQLLGCEMDDKWFPDLRQYDAGEYFIVLSRGFRVFEKEQTSSPFVMIKNCGRKNPFNMLLGA